MQKLNKEDTMTRTMVVHGKYSHSPGTLRYFRVRALHGLSVEYVGESITVTTEIDDNPYGDSIRRMMIFVGRQTTLRLTFPVNDRKHRKAWEKIQEVIRGIEADKPGHHEALTRLLDFWKERRDSEERWPNVVEDWT
jgi:hypothetical protein